MKIEKLRIVLDTNIILASILQLSPYRKIIDALNTGIFDLFLDNEMLLEYEEKLSSIFGTYVSDNFLTSLSELPNIQLMQSWYRLNLIPADPDDNKFVDCAFACNAHYLVSNDKHLQKLKQIGFPSINVLKADEFIEVLNFL